MGKIVLDDNFYEIALLNCYVLETSIVYFQETFRRYISICTLITCHLLVKSSLFIYKGILLLESDGTELLDGRSQFPSKSKPLYRGMVSLLKISLTQGRRHQDLERWSISPELLGSDIVPRLNLVEILSKKKKTINQEIKIFHKLF